ncbi:MAG: cadherin-like beta sandwich domain-containing protein [Catonella sp.]|uniref:cadherin-like beta sandwich domain-containing protein n=1 Tax=Catonella sp. TaxID=2382125 RepID=UPI003FA01604
MLKKILIKSIMIAFMLGVFCGGLPSKEADINKIEAVYAAEKKMAVCTAEKLRIRTDAGINFPQLTSNGNKVYLLLNEKAEVKGEKTAANGQKWYKVTFKFNGKKVTGFALSDFIKIQAEKDKTEKKEENNSKNNISSDVKLKEVPKYSYKAEVKIKGLRLRTDAGTDKAQYKLDNQGVVLPNGQAVNIIGEKNDSKKAKWYKISTKINKKTVKGYVLGEYVKLLVDKKNFAYAKVTAKKGAAIKVKANSKGKALKDSKGKDVVLKKDTIVSIFYEITLGKIKYFKASFSMGGKELTGYLVADTVKFVGVAEDEAEKDDSEQETDDSNQNEDEDSSEDDEENDDESEDEDDGNGSGVIGNNNNNKINNSGQFVAQKAYITSDKVEIYNERDYKSDILKEIDTGISYKLSMNQEVIARKQYTVGNEKWYLITYIVNDSTGKQVIGAGFIPEKFIKLSGEPVDDSTGSSNKKKLSDKKFEESLAEQRFPEDYKPFLRELHKAHPYWHFEARHLGLDWEYAVEKESVVGLNLLHNSKNYAWKSMEEKAYDWVNDAFIAYDGSGWVTASNKAVRYYMDPRNFLNEDYIYQFELLSFKPEYHTEKGIEAILSGSPMKDTFFDYIASDGTKNTMSYAETFLLAGIYSGVSPYHLASRVKQEVAGGGKFSSSVTGTVAGHEGYYNFYNIGAYNNTAPGGAVASGLKFAANGSLSKTMIGSKSFNEFIKIPWNNRYDAILGGAAYIVNNYILRGQNTPYLEKFNFTDKNTFSHQYMAAIFSPGSESLITKKAYAELMDEPLVFSIPVFENMPVEISAIPEDILSPNNWLSSLKATGYSITPTFKPSVTEGYSIVVGRDVEFIELTGKTASKKAVVTGLGQIRLAPSGLTEVQVEVVAENGDIRTYKIKVAKEG